MSDFLLSWLDPTALAWTLLHALWIGALVPLVCWAVLAVLPARRASLRHAVATGGVFATVLLAAGVHGALVAEREHAAAAPPAAAPLLSWPTAPESADRRPETPPTPTVRGFSPTAQPPAEPGIPWQPLLCGVWLLGVAVSLARTAAGVRGARHLGRGAADAPPWLQELADRLRRSMGSARLVAVRVVDDRVQPVCIGLLRPVVLRPASLVSGEPGALRFVLAHELAHARGLHPLVAVATEVAASLLFFHPGVRWLAGQAALERECVADLAAARACGDAPEAAASRLGRFVAGPAFPVAAAVGFASPGSGVLARMKRLLAPGDAPRGPAPRVMIPVVLVAVAVLIGVQQGAKRLTEAALSGDEFVQLAEEATADVPVLVANDAPHTAAVRGVVRFADGSSPEGRVQVSVNVSSPSLGYGGGGRATTESDGTVTFASTDLPPGTAVVSVSGEGFAPGVAEPVRLGVGEEVEGVIVTVDRGFATTLRLTGPGGEPLAGLTPKVVAVLGNSHKPVTAGPTEADGRVVLPHAPAGTELRLFVEASGFQPHSSTWTPTPDGEHAVALAEAVPTNAIVVDAESGAPLAGAEVYIVRGFGLERSTGVPDARVRRRNPPDAVTDADGRFTLDTLVPGTEGSLWVSHPDHAAFVSFGLFAGGSDWRLPLRDAIAPEVVIENPEVLDRENRKIRWWQTPRYASDSTGWVNGERISLPEGDSTGPLRLPLPGPVLDAPLNVEVGGETFRFPDPRAGELRIVLGRPAPTREVVVRLVPPAGWPEPTGTARLNASAVGERYGALVSKDVERGELRLEVATGPDEAGSFRILQLQSPGYRLARPADSDTMPVPSGTEPLVVTRELLPAGSARGRIVDERGGPVVDARGGVRIVEQNADHGKLGYADQNDFWNLDVAPDGTFATGGLPLGATLRLTADANAGSEAYGHGDTFTVTREDPVFTGTVVLPDGVDVRVRALGPDGRPVAGHPLHLSFRSADRSAGGAERETDARGEVVFRGVNTGLDGTHAITSDTAPGVVADGAETGGWLEAEVPVPAAGGDVEIRLQPGRVLRGRIVDDATDRPMPNAAFRLQRIDADWHDAVTNLATAADGTFAVGGLPPGRWQLHPDWDTGFPPGTVVTPTPTGSSRSTPPGVWDALTFDVPSPTPVEARIVPAE